MWQQSEKRSEAFLDEIRAVLRENQIAYTSVSRAGSDIRVALKRNEDIGRAQPGVQARHVDPGEPH